MKFRTSFVTNSSSSSYTCSFCGRTESGWDMCLSEAEMFECVNGHTFCEYHLSDHEEGEYRREAVLKEAIRMHLKHLRDYKAQNPDKYDLYYSSDEMLTDEEFENMTTEELDEYASNYDIDYQYDFPAKYCPICGFTLVTAEDAYKLMLKDDKITEEEFAKKVKERFGSYENFKKYLNEKPTKE